jgi:uncharacterized membrane protein YbaN (DUF454 family)
MVSTPARQSDAPQLPDDFAGSAPAREPRVVHSSHGRLRAHLPHWSGERGEEIAAALQLLPGVHHAEASCLTGNVLILFDPEHISEHDLLQLLPCLHLDPPTPSLWLPGDEDDPLAVAEQGVPVAVADPGAEPTRSGGVVYMTGTGRVVYKALGWSSVGLAVVGAITPGIPTAPFVILAGYFFIRSSPEAHQWLRQSRWFGTLLRDWEDHRGIRRSVRNVAAGLIGGSMVVTAFLGLPMALTATIISLQVIGLAIVLRLRVIDPAAPAPAVV